MRGRGAGQIEATLIALNPSCDIASVKNDSFLASNGLISSLYLNPRKSSKPDQQKLLVKARQGKARSSVKVATNTVVLQSVHANLLPAPALG